MAPIDWDAVTKRVQEIARPDYEFFGVKSSGRCWFCLGDGWVESSEQLCWWCGGSGEMTRAQLEESFVRLRVIWGQGE